MRIEFTENSKRKFSFLGVIEHVINKNEERKERSLSAVFTRLQKVELDVSSVPIDLHDRITKLESLANTTEVKIGKEIKDCGGFIPLDNCGTMIDSMRKELGVLKTENEQLKSDNEVYKKRCERYEEFIRKVHNEFKFEVDFI